jgi:hypothetical protein
LGEGQGAVAHRHMHHAGAVVGLHLLEEGVLRIVVNAAADVVVGELLNHLGARAALRARGVVVCVMTVVRLQLGEGVGVRVLMSGGSLARDGCRMVGSMVGSMVVIVVIVVSLEGRPRTDLVRKAAESKHMHPRQQQQERILECMQGGATLCSPPPTLETGTTSG